MVSKPKTGKRKQPAKTDKHDKKKQNSIGAWLRAILAMLKTLVLWNEKSKTPVTITQIAGRKDGNKPTYSIVVRSIDNVVKRGAAALGQFALMTVGKAQAPTPEQVKDKAKENPYLVSVMKILKRLKRLDRYKQMDIILVNSNTIRVVMTGDKPVHLVYLKADLAKLRRMAVKSRGAKAVEGWAEYNLCLQLVAMQGQLPVAKSGDKLLIGVVAYSPKGAKFHEQRLIAAVYTKPDGQVEIIKGRKDYRAFNKGKEVPLFEISKALGNWKQTDKDGKKHRGFYHNGKNNKFLPKTNDGSYVIKRDTTDMLEAAKAAGVFAKWPKLKFEQVHTQHYSEAADGQNTVWGLLSSMTNGTQSGDKGHIKTASRRKWFHNISLKRLLAGYPEEMALLNDENQGIVAEIKDILGLAEYSIPAVYLTKNKEWSQSNDDHLSEMMSSPAFQAKLSGVHDPNTAGRRRGDVPEVLSHPEFNRWWKHTGLTATIKESDASYSAESDEEESFSILELIVTEAVDPQQANKPAE